MYFIFLQNFTMKTKIILLIFISFFTLNNSFANYNNNINDDIKIYKFDNIIKKYIEKSKNPKITKKNIINKIENILWKNNSEINTLYSKKNFKNFKEYALVKIYDFLTKWDMVEYNHSILENDYIKIITTDKDLKINNQELYSTYNNKKYLYIKFIKINPEIKTEKYIQNSLKCEIKKNTDNFIKFTKEKIFYTKNCKYSNNWINYFQRISKNILIYINAGQDYNWIDFNSIEIKKLK